MPTASSDTQRRSSNAWHTMAFALAAGLLVALVAATLWIASRPDLRLDTRSRAGIEEYTALIDAGATRARLAGLQAHEAFQTALRQINDTHERNVIVAGQQASTAVQQPLNLLRLLSKLSWDAVSSNSTGDDYLREVVVAQVFDPVAMQLQQEVGDAADRLQYELRRINAALALELAAAATQAEPHRLRGKVTIDFADELRTPLNPLLIGAVVGGLESVSEVQVLVLAARRIFAKQVTRLAASAAIAGADGPLPIGDVIALLGVI